MKPIFSKSMHPSNNVDTPDLDVTPIMNMFIILIPFLAENLVGSDISGTEFFDGAFIFALVSSKGFAGLLGNQGDLLSTLLVCAGIPLDRPVGIATKQLKEITTDG